MWTTAEKNCGDLFKGYFASELKWVIWANYELCILKNVPQKLFPQVTIAIICSSETRLRLTMMPEGIAK